MSLRFIGLIGILTGIFFFGGLTMLFILNPQTYEELNNLSLASYNITGMSCQLWAAIVLYGMTGLLNIAFCVGILKGDKQLSAGLVGKILLLVCGLTWISFGVFPYNFEEQLANHLLMIRLIVLIIGCVTSFFLLANDYRIVSQDKLLKWLTISCATLILLLGTLSTFVYNDNTWVRTNISLVIYFSWFVAFGLRVYSRAITNKPSLL